jgi:hypothetical protein
MFSKSSEIKNIDDSHISIHELIELLNRDQLPDTNTLVRTLNYFYAGIKRKLETEPVFDEKKSLSPSHKFKSGEAEDIESRLDSLFSYFIKNGEVNYRQILAWKDELTKVMLSAERSDEDMSVRMYLLAKRLTDTLDRALERFRKTTESDQPVFIDKDEELNILLKMPPTWDAQIKMLDNLMKDTLKLNPLIKKTTFLFNISDKLLEDKALLENLTREDNFLSNALDASSKRFLIENIENYHRAQGQAFANDHIINTINKAYLYIIFFGFNLQQLKKSFPVESSGLLAIRRYAFRDEAKEAEKFIKETAEKNIKQQYQEYYKMMQMEKILKFIADKTQLIIEAPKLLSKAKIEDHYIAKLVKTDANHYAEHQLTLKLFNESINNIKLNLDVEGDGQSATLKNARLLIATIERNNAVILFSTKDLALIIKIVIAAHECLKMPATVDDLRSAQIILTQALKSLKEDVLATLYKPESLSGKFFKNRLSQEIQLFSELLSIGAEFNHEIEHQILSMNSSILNLS